MCFRTLNGFVAGCVLLLVLLTQSSRAIDRPAAENRLLLAPGEERVALSLRVLASRVSQALAKKEPLPEDCRTLAGIGWIEGYLVADDAKPDIILFGRKSPTRTSLRLDDLVVSLRCVGQGQFPYCSLDPREASMVALQNLLQRNQGSQVEPKAQFEAVKKAIGPQQVVVGGVPRNSRHGRIMIAADYHMKKVSQGLVSVPGVVSCPDRAIQQAKAHFEKVGTLSATGAKMSRFWFHLAAGDPKFSEESGSVWLDRCRVVVLTEQQRISASGKLSDAQQEDPQAAAFARELSEAFPQLTSTIPVYAELENLFRLHAVTLVMAQRGVLNKLGFDCGSYLAGYRLTEEKPLLDALPGLANYRELTLPYKQGNREGTVTLFPMVCGGVGMDMRAEQENFSRSSGTRLSEVSMAAFSSRPAHDTFAWTLPKITSTKEVTFFAVNNKSAETTIWLPHAVVKLQSDELKSLQSGQRLKDSHPLSQALAKSGRMLVLYTPESKSAEDVAAADRVAFALQKAYREKQFGQSAVTTRTTDTAESFGAMRLQGLDDLVTVIAGDSFGVQDYNLKGNLPGALRQAKLNVDIRFVERDDQQKYQGGQNKQMIVISGHISEKLLAFLVDLGKRGYFRGNHVLLNTCSDAKTRAAALKMIKQHGALTVFRYEREIKAGEVQDFLIDLFNRSRSGTEEPFIDVIRDVLQKYDLNGIWDFCRLDAPLWKELRPHLAKVGRGADGRDQG
jgi:hypothetical protein